MKEPTNTVGPPKLATSTHESTPSHLDDRARALRVLRDHGYGGNTFQILESGYRYWFHEDQEGTVVVAYVPVRRFCVVPGGPVGPRAALGRALDRFREFAQSQRRLIMLVGVETWFLDCLGDRRAEYDVIKLGEQPEWRPNDFTIEGPTRRSLRAQD